MVGKAPASKVSNSARAERLWGEASRLQDQGDFKDAFRLMKDAAQGGYIDAQLGLGYYYDVGIGTRRNQKQALYWYRRAAARGNSSAANNIGIVYRDLNKRREALRWFRRAVELGDDGALLEAAKMRIGDARQHRAIALELRKVIKSKAVMPIEQEEAQRLLEELGRYSGKTVHL